MFSERDHFWMEHAISLARIGELKGEVPVGAVLIWKDEILGEGWNQPIGSNDPTAHAEIIALREGAAKFKNYRLSDAILYVTLEPCLMCVGAIIQARVSHVIFGAHDHRFGAVESAFQIKNANVNHHALYQGGLLNTTCATLLKDFFIKKRQKEKEMQGNALLWHSVTKDGE